MRRMVKPRASAEQALRLAASNYLPYAKTQVEELVPLVSAASATFEAAAQSATYHLFPHAPDPDGVIKRTMIGLYENKLAKAEQPGYSLYLELRGASERGFCPLCAQRQVSTLDHFLEKALFPLLAVTPTNLVPACHECNYEKRKHRPKNEDEFTLNPYFDDLGDGVWLEAEIVNRGSPVVLFLINPAHTWPATLHKRVIKHFTVFRIHELYVAHAAVELVAIKRQLQNAHLRGGAEGLREFLVDAAESRSIAGPNTWSAALYRAAAKDEWFCNLGFAAIK